MAELAQQSKPTDCPIEMSDGKPCGRPIHFVSRDIDARPVCLMHSKDPNKSLALFQSEIGAIVYQDSEFHRPENQLDFSRFVFPIADFDDVIMRKPVTLLGAKFIGKATFTKTRFREEVSFQSAEFHGPAYFFDTKFKRADFSGAKFFEVGFWGVEFNGYADFHGVEFRDKVQFSEVYFGDIANFIGSQFSNPARSVFRNVGSGLSGFPARWRGCYGLGQVVFVDVAWRIQEGRIVVQDENDLYGKYPGPAERPARGEVVSVYKDLVSNFEEKRAYDLADMCFCSAMEVHRLRPRALWHRLAPYDSYRRFWLQWICEQVSLANLYRLASKYGTSYQRAGVVLVLVIVAFVIAFSFFDLIPNPEVKPVPVSAVVSSWAHLKAGLIHALEVATFRRDALYIPTSRWGYLFEIIEQLLLAIQVSIFLLALRRRFRR